MTTSSSLHLTSKETIQNALSINFIDCSELYKLILINCLDLRYIFLLYKKVVLQNLKL